MQPILVFSHAIGISLVLGACGGSTLSEVSSGENTGGAAKAPPAGNVPDEATLPGGGGHGAAAPQQGTAGGGLAGASGASVEPDPVCSDAQPLSSPEDLIAVVNALAWQYVYITRTGTLTLSSDLMATEDLEVEPWGIGPPSDNCCEYDHGTCQPRFGACAVEDRWEEQVPGVRCLIESSFGCDRLHIAKGTVFRVRRVIQATYLHPHCTLGVEITQPCAAPCEPDEVRCVATQTCFRSGFDACAYCDGEDMAACVCRDEQGALPNGAECFLPISPDYELSGTCQAGWCVLP